MTEFAIEIDHIHKKFGTLRAVDDLSLTVKKGEIFGFLGPNGAGKTTTIKMLCGLLSPDSGKGSVVGCDLFGNTDAIKRNVGYMAQHFSLYPDLTVAENFAFFAGVYGLQGSALAERMNTLLGRVELRGRENDAAGKLSGGQRQRLALACALVHNPKLVFLDEPTAGVDPNQRQRLWDLLYDLCEDGTTLFVTTHYLDEAERCHRVGFMHAGKLIAHDAPRALRDRLRGRLFATDVDEHPVRAMRALGKIDGVEDITLYGNELRLFFTQSPSDDAWQAAVKQKLDAEGIGIKRFYPLEPTLEDLFMSYTRGST